MTSTRCSHCRPCGRPFLVARRADFDDAIAVARRDVRPLRRDVHPADIIAVALAHQREREVVHPVGIRPAQARPVVGRALRVAGEPDETAVQPDAARARAALELGLAKAGLRLADIHHLAVHGEDGINAVKIRVVHVPEARAGQRAGGGENFRLAGDQVGGVAFQLRAHHAVGVHHDGRKRDEGVIARLVDTSASTFTSAVFFARSMASG